MEEAISVVPIMPMILSLPYTMNKVYRLEIIQAEVCKQSISQVKT